MKKRIKEKEFEHVSKLNRISKPMNYFFNLFFIICSVACILPVLFIVAISFTSESSLMAHGYQLIPKEFSLNAYKFLWNERITIFGAFKVSVLVTIAGTIFGVALTTAMGYVLSRPEYKLKEFFTWVVFIPMIFNGGLVSSYVVNANILNLKDSALVLIIPLAVSSFNIIICKTFFRTSIPDSIVESAQIDGASQLNIYLRIILPISKPVMATIALFLSFGYWNDWFQSSLYISNTELYSLQALLNNIQKKVEYLAGNPTAGLSLQQYLATIPKESARMAIAIVIIAPIACAYPFFQKYFITGLTIGAVKG